ncbi:2Fe-2S iron-sulfur cluster-binding protein [Noviherbaspirillum denitrificans]|uniref:2Fe-2S iron-sulfur cluster-binding protein n=1 Tax=Noviherbaspirillum denitrificans TaxID=1968433 RepID=UPI000B52E154|nr:2Fe-2S iron-sulfur cluster-binding protein [Noviherbaspirillum denitrificans]
MPRAFSQIAFTPSVRVAQERYRSREANAAFDLDPNARNVVTGAERQFFLEVDTFFMASTGENGWPYVQHRGGPKGFLKVLDDRTIGFADFAGNRQYISAGNLSNDDRVMLILMDFANRRRLKVWGRARIVHESSEPELIALLEVDSYRARIERGVVIQVEAFDFNCPQHITPRFTEAEFMARIRPQLDELEQLRERAKHQSMPKAAASPLVLGTGELELAISAVRQLTPRIRAYELRRPDGGDLPAVRAGAHLSLPMRLEDGSVGIRSYSISSNPMRRDAYEIAVLKEDTGRGGSIAVHKDFNIGTILRCGMPKNAFPLHGDDRPAVLIAGGIGITPIKAMAQELKQRGAEFQLHYSARSRREMAYWSKLKLAMGERARFYFSDESASARLDVGKVLAAAPDDAVFYVCGPARLIEAVVESAKAHGIPESRVKFERFMAKPVDGKPISVRLARSKLDITVAADQSILDAVLNAGVDAPFSCREGVCGMCATKVLDGEVEHNDTALTDAERDKAALMCTCVSRARTASLVLDL